MVQFGRLQVAHETAICCNPPVHNFTWDGGGGGTLHILNVPVLKRVMFLQKSKVRPFFFGHTSFTEGVFVTHCLLTLRLLMSYIYGAPSKARNANVVYIWT